jgi:ABC-type branched-subunit amino acid transport system substrate-binding protein
MADLDFDVDVRSLPDGGYEVVVRSPGGNPRGRMQLPFLASDLRTRILTIENALLRSAQPLRQSVLDAEKPVRDFGQELFGALIAGDIRKAFDRSFEEAKARDRPLRIKLNFDSPTLSGLPWEFLIDPEGHDYLVLSQRTPIVRSIPSSSPVKAMSVKPPLRMLGLIASPKKMPKLGIERERARVEDAIAELRRDGLITIRWLETGTYRELQEALQEQRYHIFHFAGHGGFDVDRDTGILVFVNEEDGGPDRVSATDLVRLLGDRPPQLAVLNACEGAVQSTHDMFSSTAATLVQRWTPAVIAMQYDITDEAAKEFSRSFYAAIANNLPVEAAVAEARKSVSHALEGTLEWGTPVLFMRSDGGVLFRLRRPKRPTATSQPPIPPPAIPVAAVAVDDTLSGNGGLPPAGAQPGTTLSGSGSSLPLAGPTAPLAERDGGVGTTDGTVARPAEEGGPDRRDRIVLAAVGALAAGGVIVAALLFATAGKPGASASPSTFATVSSPSISPSESPIGPSSSPSVSPVVSALTDTTLLIGFELSTPGHPGSRGVREGVQLAILDAGGRAGIWHVGKSAATTLFDDTTPVTGAENITTLGGTPEVMAVVGPYSSSVGLKQIPISNRAGLLQCSASASSEELTRPDTRPANPDRINFVRTVATNDSEAPASARFIYDSLGKSSVYVIDTTVNTAVRRADLFAKAFAERGGVVQGRVGIDMRTADLSAVVTVAKADGAETFYLSGSSGVSAFAARLLRAIRDQIPDAVFVSSGEIFGSADAFLAGAQGYLANTYTGYEVAGDFPGRATFESRYRDAFGHAAGLYSAAGYACGQVILDAISRVTNAKDLAELREAVRAAAVDPAVSYDSLIGSFHFDANGDTSSQLITFYRGDPDRRTWTLLQTIDAGG